MRYTVTETDRATGLVVQRLTAKDAGEAALLRRIILQGEARRARETGSKPNRVEVSRA